MNSISSEIWFPSMILKLPSEASNLRIWTSFSAPPPMSGWPSVSTITSTLPSRCAATRPCTNRSVIESSSGWPGSSVAVWVMKPAPVPTMSRNVIILLMASSLRIAPPIAVFSNSMKNVVLERVILTMAPEALSIAASISPASWSSSSSRLRESRSRGLSVFLPSPRMSNENVPVVHGPPRFPKWVLSILKLPSVPWIVSTCSAFSPLPPSLDTPILTSPVWNDSKTAVCGSFQFHSLKVK